LKKKSMSTWVNISNSWPESWEWEDTIGKNYKTQFLTNQILKNKIEKKLILKKDLKKKIAFKRMRTKWYTKTKQ
jgi:hypothetical protein